jgi:hypothetical protein
MTERSNSNMRSIQHSQQLNAESYNRLGKYAAIRTSNQQIPNSIGAHPQNHEAPLVSRSLGSFPTSNG